MKRLKIVTIVLVVLVLLIVIGLKTGYLTFQRTTTWETKQEGYFKEVTKDECQQNPENCYTIEGGVYKNVAK